MYAANADTDADEYKRAICKIVMNVPTCLMGPILLSPSPSNWRELSRRRASLWLAYHRRFYRFFTGTAHGYKYRPAD